MPDILCRLRDLTDSEKTVFGHPTLAEPGDMWFCGEYLEKCPESLSPYYRQFNSHRKPLMVVCPNGDWFLIDGMASKDGVSFGNGWTVVGDAPLITVSPSIHLVGRWHGWLKSGILSTC